MAGPWEKYQQAAPQSGPWSRYQDPSMLDTVKAYGGPFLTGLGSSVLGLASMAAGPTGAVSAARPDTYAPADPRNWRTAAEGVTGQWREPEKGNVGQEFAKQLGTYAPALAGGNPLDVVLPAAGAEAGKVATRGKWYEPYAEAGGGLAGGLLSTGIQAATRHPIPANQQADVDLLTQEGIEPTQGQATGSKSLAIKEAQRGGAAYQARVDKQAEQLTAAAAKRAGLNANRLTPQVVSDYLDDIGAKFDKMASRSSGRIVPNDSIKADQIITNYQELTEGAPAPLVARLGKTFSAGGEITGDKYQALRTDLDRALRGNASPNMKDALYQLRGLLDDVVERGMDTSLRGAWTELRRNYKNWIALEKAADPTTGLVSPASLERGAISAGGKRAYMSGRSDYTDLAQSAGRVLTKPPSSGTAENLSAIVGKLAGITGRAGVGGAVGSLLGGGPVGGILGAGVSAAYPYISDRLLMSPGWQNYLRSQTPGAWVLPWAATQGQR